MTLTFAGVSKCPICDEILDENQELVSIPMLTDKDHHLADYFDNTIHRPCFDDWDFKETVITLIEKEREEYINEELEKTQASDSSTFT